MKTTRMQIAALVLLGLWSVAGSTSPALGDNAAGTGDGSTNVPYIDSDPDEGIETGVGSVVIEVDGYHTGYPDCWVCDEMGDYACSPYLPAYPGWGWPTSVGFVDPIPAGHYATRIEATVNGVGCSTVYGGTGETTVNINGIALGHAFQTGTCPCGFCDPFTIVGPDSPCGMTGYNYGGVNQLAIVIDGVSCISDVHLEVFYRSDTPPTCDAGGPYSAECQGATTDIPLNGSGSGDDCGHLTYLWETDCPGGSFDSDTIVNPTLTVDSITPCPLTCNVTLTVDDGISPPVSCGATVTVTDTAPPVFTTAPANVSFECDGAGNTAEIQAWLDSAAATDTCGGAVVTNDYTGLSDDCGATGSAMVTWTATDDCGTQAFHSATVTVVDTTPPVFTSTPGDVWFECDGAGNTAQIQAWLDSAAASDTCGGVTVVNDFVGLSDDCGATGSAYVTWTATDDCGVQNTHSATVTVVDTTAPSFTFAPTNLTIECGSTDHTAAIQAWLNSAAASDVCGGVMITNDFVAISPGCGNTGGSLVTWTAEDDCGLQTIHSATVQIVDTTPPVFTTAPTNVTFECDGSGNTAEVQAWLNSAAATDQCAGVIVTNDFVALSDDCGATGSAYVTWTATDDCGLQETHSATVTVADTTSPSIDTAAGDLTVECDGAGNAADLSGWLTAYGGAAASDACGGVSWSDDYASLTAGCAATGAALVTFTATDDCMNDASTAATFTIEDTTAPDITCPADASVTLPDPSDPSATGEATADDDCGTVPDIDYADQAPVHVQYCPTTTNTTRVWTATDECGIPATCEQVIEIIEPIPAGYCCNPTDGTLTVIDDGDPCTEDICNELTGAVTHPDNGLCHACCNLYGIGTCDLTLQAVCPDAAENFHIGEDCSTDSDGDGVADPCDMCPGVDDTVYGPNCGAAIPTMSEWGLLVLALLMLSAGKVYFGTRRMAAD